MNVYDSARIAEVLAPLGFQVVHDPFAAELVVLNTCHIRQKAAEKLYSELGRLQSARLSGSGRPRLLAVAGCVAQAEGDEILARAPFVDIIVGSQAYHQLPKLLAAAEANGSGVVATEFPLEPKFDLLPEAQAPVGATSAFLTVQEGCDRFCTFCVVPYTRGAEYSRPVAEILAEAKRYAACGVREVTLVGQNVNAFRGEAPEGGRWGLAGLIAALARIPGIERIRYTTSHPSDMNEALIEAHGDVPQLMPYVHLPVQSGSNRILAAMNRRHTVDDYRRVVERLRQARADLALSSDFIVGFPGETDVDFAETVALVDEIGFAQAFSFKYSERPGTSAAVLGGHVSAAVKAERLAILQTHLTEQQRVFNSACVGRTLPVLFDRVGRFPGQLTGRSPYLQAVCATLPPDCIGTAVDVRITGVGHNSLSGCAERRAVT
jgi:tRNA-2-methylthio-N6-dimethylallyladenosine synthase